MIKSILSELYTRVFLAYRSTLLGVALAAAEVIAQQLAGSNNVALHAAAGVALTLLALYRGQSAPPAQRGFVRAPVLALLSALALAGCATLTALNGTTGPIPVAVAPAAGGGTTATATVTVTAAPVTGLPPSNCGKPVTISFDSLSGYHDSCSAVIPVAATNGVCR